MQSEEVRRCINNIIFDSLKDRIAFEDITPEKHIINDLNADSINALEIFLTVMSDFNIEMERRIIVGLNNIGELYHYVESLINANEETGKKSS